MLASDAEIRIDESQNLTFDFEKCRQQLELVFLGRDRVGQLLAVVEGLQQGLKAIVYQRHLERHLEQFMDWRREMIAARL